MGVLYAFSFILFKGSLLLYIFYQSFSPFAEGFLFPLVHL